MESWWLQQQGDVHVQQRNRTPIGGAFRSSCNGRLDWSFRNNHVIRYLGVLLE